MNAPTPCPDVHALRAFVEGGADAVAALPLKRHLAACAYCRGIAEGLVATRKVSVPGDTGWTEIAQDSTASATPERTTTHLSGLDDPPDLGLPGAGDRARAVVESPEHSATALVPNEDDDDGDLSLTYLLPAVRPDTLGRLGDYDVLGVLGRGGMGVVLKAYDSALNRVVAVKVLAPALAGRHRSRHQFIAEARSAAAINHPNVVTIHDVKVQRGMPYLVMEYLGGQTLRQRIQEGPRLRPVELVRIAVQIARGLAAAHEQGVIHRDIKPGNVMLEGDLDRVKLTDFGLAKIAHGLTEQTSLDRIIGTPAYMSPETVHGQTVTERSDLFSLGCVIYAMVAGHSPFHGAQPADILHKVVSLDPTPLHALDPTVPRPLSLLVSQLLEKDPEHRPPSASAVAAVLNDLLASLQLRGDRSAWNTDSLEIPAIPAPSASRPLSSIVQGATTILIASLLLGLGIQWLSQPAAAPHSSALGLLAGTATPPSPSAPVLLVGTSSAARYRGLTAALAAVDRPNTTIRLEPGTYSGQYQISQSTALEGLTIEPAGPYPRTAVVLRGNSSHDATITVADVANVTIRRLTFDTPPAQFALAIKRHAPGLIVEDVAFSKRPVEAPEDIWSHVWLGEGARGDADDPITFRRCAFAPWQANIVLEGQYDNGPISHVNINSCRFDGGTRLIELIGAVENVHIHGCLFLGGGHGVYLDRLAGRSGRVVIDHNTFYRTEHWVDPRDCDPDLEGMAITANALLEIPTFDTTGAPLASCRDGGWNIADNQAEGPPTAVGHGLVHLTPRLAVLSRDAASPSFLRPVPGSSLAPVRAGSTGFIGALAPPRMSAARLR